MKITIIDLLKEIAEGKEDIPKEIKYKDTTYYYHQGYDFNYVYTTDKGDFLQEGKSLFQFSSYKNNRWNDNSMIDFLNEEVEVVEEELQRNEKIKMLNERKAMNDIFTYENGSNLYFLSLYVANTLVPKINEIIDYINKEDN